MDEGHQGYDMSQRITPSLFRSIRRKLKLSQDALREKLGYKNVGTISRKERGIQPITKRDEIAIRALADKATR